MIQTAALFTADECEQIALTIDRLRPYWEKTSAHGRTYVLGAASYIHAPIEGAGPPYHDRRRRLTPVMRAELDWMYARVLRALERALAAPVALAEGLAPPGFHIYVWDRRIHQLRCSVHLDLQWQSHDFTAHGAPDLDRPLSFTVALRAPSTGAGMNVWPTITTRDRRARLGPDGRRLFEAMPPVYVRYQLGELTMHSGLMYHQIAPILLEPGEWRLTLQGHGIRCGDTWQVYW